jgi:CRP-like cAMP-binding protein
MMDHPRTNSLFKRLRPETLRAIASDLRNAPLTQEQILAKPFERVRAVYFPLTALVTFAIDLSRGETAETIMVGRDGVIGADEAIQEVLAFSRATVIVPGTALSISADRLRELHSKYNDLQHVLAEHRSFFVAQCQQMAACNSVHHIDARFCRWLLQARDLLGDTFHMTQEKVAQVLGVQRASISLAAQSLQREGLVQHKRGTIVITDASGLQARSCECYTTLKRYKRATIGNIEQNEGTDLEYWHVPGVIPVDPL